MLHEYDFRGQFSCILLAGYWITQLCWYGIGQHAVNPAQKLKTTLKQYFKKETFPICKIKRAFFLKKIVLSQDSEIGKQESVLIASVFRNTGRDSLAF